MTTNATPDTIAPISTVLIDGTIEKTRLAELDADVADSTADTGNRIGDLILMIAAIDITDPAASTNHRGLHGRLTNLTTDATTSPTSVTTDRAGVGSSHGGCPSQLPGVSEPT